LSSLKTKKRKRWEISSSDKDEQEAVEILARKSVKRLKRQMDHLRVVSPENSTGLVTEPYNSCTDDN
jgi:hypothetical protein